MSLKREDHPCWILTCDHCGDGDDSEYGGNYHHQTEEAAREAARNIDMIVSEDGTVLCLTCVEECWRIVGCPKCGAPVGNECPATGSDACDERIAAALVIAGLDK